jgi:hypothetical protein
MAVIKRLTIKTLCTILKQTIDIDGYNSILVNSLSEFPATSSSVSEPREEGSEEAD